MLLTVVCQSSGVGDVRVGRRSRNTSHRWMILSGGPVLDGWIGWLVHKGSG